MTPEENARQSWQSTGSSASTPSIDQLRHGVDVFQRMIRRRNLVEYVASALVVVIFTAYVFVLKNPLARVGAGLVVFGTIYMCWQLYRRASPYPSPGELGRVSILDHQRRQIVRQRDALKSIASWYLLPFAPGLFLMVTGPALLAGGGKGPPPSPISLAFPSAIILAVFAGTWWLNRRAARRLQHELDKLDALSKD